MSISKFFFACRTGDIFRVFQMGEGKREEGGERETRVMGKCPEKEYAFHFFPADFSVARVSRSTPASCRLKNSKKWLVSRLVFFSVVTAMEMQLFR